MSSGIPALDQTFSSKCVMSLKGLQLIMVLRLKNSNSKKKIDNKVKGNKINKKYSRKRTFSTNGSNSSSDDSHSEDESSSSDSSEEEDSDNDYQIFYQSS